MLALKPWEFERLTILEFDKLVKGYEARVKEQDAREAFFATLLANVHIPKKHRLKVSDIMKALHPKTHAEVEREEDLFLQEWEAQGGETDSD